MNRLKSESRKRLIRGIELFELGDLQAASHCFQEAHILGQTFIAEHTLSHLWLWRVGWKLRKWPEIIGQPPRILASLIFSKLWVPRGNSGLASISAFKTMPIPTALQEFFDE